MNNKCNTCAIIPMNAQSLNILRGTLTRYCKERDTLNTQIPFPSWSWICQVSVQVSLKPLHFLNKKVDITQNRLSTPFGHPSPSFAEWVIQADSHQEAQNHLHKNVNLLLKDQPLLLCPLTGRLTSSLRTLVSPSPLARSGLHTSRPPAISPLNK